MIIPPENKPDKNIRKTAVKLQMSEELVRDVIEEYHAWVPKQFKREELPSVRIPSVGQLHVDPAKARNKLRKAIRHYRKTVISYEELVEHFEFLWPIYKRVQWQKVKKKHPKDCYTRLSWEDKKNYKKEDGSKG